jgi:hypothetical protein
MSTLAAARPQGSLRARTEPALLLGALAWAAGVMHAAASAEHLEEWPLAAAFFAGLMTAQLGLGAWLWARPRRRALVAAAAGSLAIVALWAVSRTVGLPFGPEAGHPEAVGVLDAMTVADELALAGCSVAVVRGSIRPLRHPLALRLALGRGRAREHPPAAPPARAAPRARRQPGRCDARGRARH